MNRKHLYISTLSIVLVLFTLACSVPTQASPDSNPLAGSTDAVPTPLPGPCENILYPLLPGNQWVYQGASEEGEGGKFGLTVEKVENSMATLNALEMSTGVITQTTVECREGAILNFPAMSVSMLLGDFVSGDITLAYVSGTMAPPTSEFLANNWDLSWQGDYLASGTFQVTAEEGPMTIEIAQSPVHMDWKTAGAGDAAFESVTVPAGTYPHALKVTRTMTMEVSMDMDGMEITGTLELLTTQWFEPSVGMLKMTLDGGNLTYLVMSFPVEMTASLEMVEFRPAK